MNGCRLTDSVLYVIQYATLKYIPTTQSIKVCRIDVYLLFDSYLHSYTITSIKPGAFEQLDEPPIVVTIRLFTLCCNLQCTCTLFPF